MPKQAPSVAGEFAGKAPCRSDMTTVRLTAIFVYRGDAGQMKPHFVVAAGSLASAMRGLAWQPDPQAGGKQFWLSNCVTQFGPPGRVVE